MCEICERIGEEKNKNTSTLELCLHRSRTAWKWQLFNALFIIFETPANSGQTPLRIGNPFHLILWIKEFLCNQGWHVKWNGCLSNEPALNTSVPQGRAISSFLLSIYTDKIMCNNNCLVLIKHADNAAQEARLTPSQPQQKKTMLRRWQIAFHSRRRRRNSRERRKKQKKHLASSMSSSSLSKFLMGGHWRRAEQRSWGRVGGRYLHQCTISSLQQQLGGRDVDNHAH